MSKEEEIILEKMEEIYYVWDYVSKEQARDILKKMYFQEINDYKNIESKRLVLHNLTTVIMQIRKDMNSAKFYSKTLKDMLDNYPNYKSTQINKERYCKALNNYTVCYEDELTSEELIEIYGFCYETYKDYDHNHVDQYLEKLIAEFNLSLIKRDLNQVFIVVENLIIHTTTKQHEEILQNFIDSIEIISKELYEEVLSLIEINQAKVV
jgi:hypothetical protein